MTDYREILRLNHQGISGRDIAKSCGCSRNTVARVLGKAREHGMTWQSAEEKTNGDLRDLFFPGVPAPFSRTRPDCEYIHREMGKSGVTLTLLWQEYCEKCRTNGDIPLMYSQFCLCCQKYAQSAEATMRLVRRPGESAEVDWAGQKALWLDPDTGERMEAPVFVGVLSSSRYAYVEAFSDQDQESWLTAHVNMFRYFGGVPRILVPDNLKTGITRADRYDPVINRVYRELAEHYGTAVIPARVRKPRDKPNAEGTVGIVTTWILAALRDRVFFSIRELNEGIAEKLERFNAKPFQKKEGSRLDAFLAEEKAALLPLPEIPYELSSWKKGVADKSYHVSVEKMLYSVPFEYIGHEMEIRLTRNVVEIFFDSQRVCSHTRLRGRSGQCSTVPSHMPPEHRKYSLWDGSRFVSWAEDVGPHTAVVMRGILSAHAVEQQSYRSCYGLVRLGDTCSFERLEAACEKALLYTPRPGYRNVKTILTRVKLISGVWTLKNKWRILPIGLAGSQSTLEGYAMKKCTASSSSGPEATVPDPLTELLRKGARDLIAKAVEAELEALLEDCSSLRLKDGRAAVVRNGYLPGRAVQTGIGDVEVRVPKVRDRSGSGIVFNSSLLPPYLKRAKNVEEFLPWLYLKGVSTGGYGEALHSLLGENAKGLSANTISRLKEKWTEEHQEWNRRDLSGKKYVYWWADGVYSRVRMDDKLCLLVIIGTTEKGEKELVAVEDGYRESEASWHEVLSGLRSRGLKDGPKLAVGDGSLGFWNALRKEYPECVHQRCWVHKTANVLNKVPKSLQGKMKADLHEIWMAETKEEAGKAFDRATAKYGAKYPKAIDCLTKDREELLAFYSFPAVHWVHIRTSNPVESAFSTIRLRTAKTRNCGSRATTLAMVFKLAQSAEKRWRKLKGFELLGEVVTGVIFKDGIRVSDQSDRSAA